MVESQRLMNFWTKWPWGRIDHRPQRAEMVSSGRPPAMTLQNTSKATSTRNQYGSRREDSSDWPVSVTVHTYCLRLMIASTAIASSSAPTIQSQGCGTAGNVIGARAARIVAICLTEGYFG